MCDAASGRARVWLAFAVNAVLLLGSGGGGWLIKNDDALPENTESPHTS